MIRITECHFILYAGLLGVTLLVASLYIHVKERAIAAALVLNVENQQARLNHMAEVIDQGGADPAVDAVIKDCTAIDRERFDSLLGALATLNKTELLEVDRLFGMCGNYYAERKAVMVSRFKREYEVYTSYLTTAAILDGRVLITKYPRTEYEQLVALEETRSSLSNELVSIQAAIITDLQAGELPHSEKITTRLTRAQEVNDTLGYTGIQIDALRAHILSL